MSAVILVIDEDLNLRLSIAQILREAGNVVVVAETRWDALEMLKVLHFDLLFLDVKSRTPSEIAFIKEIQETSPEVPLLILNTYPRFEQACHGKVNSEVRYLVKPIDPPAILDTIEGMLARA